MESYIENWPYICCASLFLLALIACTDLSGWFQRFFEHNQLKTMEVPFYVILIIIVICYLSYDRLEIWRKLNREGSARDFSMEMLLKDLELQNFRNNLLNLLKIYKKQKNKSRCTSDDKHKVYRLGVLYDKSKKSHGMAVGTSFC